MISLECSNYTILRELHFQRAYSKELIMFKNMINSYKYKYESNDNSMTIVAFRK